MNDTRRQMFDAAIKILGLAGVFVGFLIGFYQYKDAKEKEFYSHFWNLRLDTYAEVSEAAANIATASTMEDAKDSRRKFWEYFYGPMSLVEDNSVKKAMETFGRELKKIESTNGKPSDLEQASYRLSLALRNSLRNTWSRPFMFEGD